MASFDEHIDQAKYNLKFLSSVNNCEQEFWDWKVTICFYVGVHLVNAHLAKKMNIHYRSHEDVKNAISPNCKIVTCRIPESTFIAFNKLQSLSRRARYLCSDASSKNGENAFFTHDKHLYKAVKNLDELLFFMKNEYSITFNKTKLNCLDLLKSELHFFQFEKNVVLKE